MNFRFIYEPSEFGRIIPSCIIDSRASIPAIRNQVGSVIKAYFDVEVNKVSGHTEVLFFKVETESGVLVGYFSLTVTTDGSGAVLNQFQIRPSFGQFIIQISAEITNFIAAGIWIQYTL